MKSDRFGRLSDLKVICTGLCPLDLNQLKRDAFRQLEVSAEDRLGIAISIPQLTALLNGPTAIPDDADPGDNIATFDLHHRLKRRGVEAKLIVGNGRDREPNRDNALINLIAQAHHWLDSLTKGEVASIADLAIHENIDRNEISRFLPLAFLAPDIIEKIVIGTQPADLTVEKLRRLGALPCAWDQQRAILGFTD